MDMSTTTKAIPSSGRSEKRPHIKTKHRRVVEDDADAFHPARFYRTKRLAELFDCDESTIWKMRKRGDLPAFTKVGNIKGLTGPQLQAVLNQRQEGE
jgi:predicted DNA-binding transcriptional regulator AlpA